MTRYWATLMALALGGLPGCPAPTGPRDDGDVETDDDGDADSDGDAERAEDSDAEGDGDADGGDLPGLSVTVEVQDGSDGLVIVELTPARAGATATVHELRPGERLDLPDLPPGPFGVLAWLDEDGDRAWDGLWSGPGEPTARLGLVLPRRGLRLVLRRGVPEPVLDGAPSLVDLYSRAIDLARDHVAAGTAANGFADHYMDEAFSEQIFQWDTCFMALFARYALDALPAMASLDNFYGVQREDGFICRVVDEDDGEPCSPVDAAEPMINPPLFAWVEALAARQSGDLSRLPRVLPVLEAYHGWLDENVRTAPGLYYTSMLGSGMDNAPRDAAYDGWVDITAQQALGRRALAELWRALGDEASARADEAEAERICSDLRSMMWDDRQRFFADLDWSGAPLPDKTLAGLWPVVAGCATAEQARRVASHLADPAEFWRVHPFPSTSADSPAYDPAGYYWRGGVWAPTNHAALLVLEAAGREDLARRAALRHLEGLDAVRRTFVPDPSELAPEALGDGRDTLWELYAPDSVRPGTRWDRTYLGRQDFVGWTGLGPIAALLEEVIGLRADALADRLTLSLHRTDRHGVRGYRFGDQLVDLVVAARASATAPATVEVVTTDAFELVVRTGGLAETFAVPEGRSTFVVDPSGAPFAVGPTPSGPFPGYAVLGNGRLAAVYSDDDGTASPPGIAHLHYRSHGLDLVELGRTLAAEGDEAMALGQVGLEPFFAASAEGLLPSGARVRTRAFVGEPDAVVVVGAFVAGEEPTAARLLPKVRLRASPHIDGGLGIAALSRDAASGALVAELDDGTALALGSRPAPSAFEAGDVPDPIASPPDGGLGLGQDLVLELALAAEAGGQAPFRWALAVGPSREAALAELGRALDAADPLADAAEARAAFAPGRLCAAGPACELAAANLHAAWASTLSGRVPADMTGQFVTNGHPQLYPRDALMVARGLERAGLAASAWPIVHDWLRSDVERPAAGELYARYDALGRAVDGGSGAPFDEPEWDSNGYLAALVERLGPAGLSPDERTRLLAGLDFLVARQDGDGLFTEGGIVEWSGRLPATAMTSWVGLDAGARLAEGWGDPARAEAYRHAAGRIRGGLYALASFDGPWLGDERDGGLSFDSSLLFGPAWGYPPDPLVEETFDWILAERRSLGFGVRYFDGNPYGEDLFFFTTAAAVEAAAARNDLEGASDTLAWIAAFSNRYGLAPERVYQDGGGASTASPLSWCAAEVAVAVLAVEEARGRSGLPAVDGEVEWDEHRLAGSCVVDHDGLPDLPGDPVALCATASAEELVLGLRLAGPPTEGTATVYLSSATGDGPEPLSARGRPLGFRADPAVLPGAEARVTVDLGSGACEAGRTLDPGWASGPCGAAALGTTGLEARVDLAALGLAPPVQAIAVVEDGLGREAALPASGSLWTGSDDGSVLVTFEVDASAIAGSLDPAAGVVVTLSGDRAELGGWAGDAVGLVDDGTGGDRMAADGLWTTTVRLTARGRVEYKYLVGTVGDGSWAGVEMEGGNRALWVQDLDRTGRVRVHETFGVRDGAVIDP